MELKFYSKDDYQELKELYEITNLYVEPNDLQATIDAQHKHDKESILLMEENSKIIGSVIIAYFPWTSMIFHLAVHPDHQNKGIGSRLLEEAENILKKKGAKKPSLLVHVEEEKLKEFYKRKGWKVYADLTCLWKEL